MKSNIVFEDSTRRTTKHRFENGDVIEQSETGLDTGRRRTTYRLNGERSTKSVCEARVIDGLAAQIVDATVEADTAAEAEVAEQAVAEQPKGVIPEAAFDRPAPAALSPKAAKTWLDDVRDALTVQAWSDRSEGDAETVIARRRVSMIEFDLVAKMVHPVEGEKFPFAKVTMTPLANPSTARFLPIIAADLLGDRGLIAMPELYIF